MSLKHWLINRLGGVEVVPSPINLPPPPIPNVEGGTVAHRLDWLKAKCGATGYERWVDGDGTHVAMMLPNGDRITGVGKDTKSAVVSLFGRFGEVKK